MKQTDLARKIRESLRKSEWLKTPDLMRYRRRTLAPLLAHARTTVPFYKDRLAPLFDGSDRIRWEHWARVPIMTRTDLQTEGERLISTNIPRQHMPTTTESSSGSTGIPLEITSTRFSGMMKNALESRLMEWAGLDTSLKMASIKPLSPGDADYPAGRMTKSWASRKSPNDRIGPLVRLNQMTPVHQQAEWLRRHDPAYLSTFPSNARALADYFAANDLKLPGLQTILPYGEIVTQDFRDRCLEVFGASVFDNYSATECGLIALQCPDASGVYHLQNETVIVEVLDEDGGATAPGKVGRVVLTTLHNYAQPLIRYRMGDLVEVGNPCTCGRHLPVINRIAGRSRHLFRFPDGTEMLPDFRSKTILKYLDPLAWQVAQTGPMTIEFRYVPGTGGASPDFDGMTTYIRAALGVEVEVNYVTRDEIHQAASGKVFDYVSEL